jgi:hypothetical protein
MAYHVVAGRIPGAVKRGKLWLIREHAERPADKRCREKRLPQQSLSSDLADVIAAATVPMPSDDPDAILDTVREERLRLVSPGANALRPHRDLHVCDARRRKNNKNEEEDQ